MYQKIDKDDITVQIESSSEDNYVVDGIALSNGRYDLPLTTTEVIVPTQRVTKNANMTLTDTWQKVTGWTVDGAHAGTTLVNNGLVATMTGAVMVSATILTDSARSTAKYQFRHNDKVVQQGALGKATSVSRVMNLIAGDRVEIWAMREQQALGWWIGIIPTPASAIVASRDSSVTQLKIEDYSDEGIDFEKDMAYGTDIGFWDDTWGRYVSPSYLKQGLPFVTEVAVATSRNGTSTSFLSRGSVSGPILAQSRAPIPVIPGSKVNFSGTFRVRKTGSKDEKTESGSLTAINARFSLWAVGTTTDEYGVESITPIEVMFYMATLQEAGSQDETMVEYVLPTIPDATIPDGMEGLYFTCSLVYQADSTYGSGTFTSRQQQGENQNIPPKSSAEMKYFGWSHANPLKVKIDLPAGIHPVTTHPLSRTGVAFKNRQLFENVKPNAKITFFGTPGSAATINVYNWANDTRGTLIGTYSAAANELKTVTVSPTGTAIELSSAGTYFVESVVNSSYRTLDEVATQVTKKTYINIIDDISKISVIREEGESGSATIDFCSDVLDPATSETLRVGKEIRILGRHYGTTNTDRPAGWVGEAEYDEIFTGVIQKINSKYDYVDEPIIQIVAYDIQERTSRVKAGVGFDEIKKYGHFMNRIGAEVIDEGFNYGGSVRALPSKYLLIPDAHGDFSLLDGFSMTRNTNKTYMIANRYNQLVFTRTINDADIALTDVVTSGSIYYGKITRKSDTEDVINQIVTEEKLLDSKDYEERSVSADRPPEDLRYPETKSQSGTFTDADSANEIGIMSKSFSVVRSSTSLRELYDGKIGPGFTEWARELLSSGLNTDVRVKDLNIPIKDSYTICKVCRLDILDRVPVTHKGETQNIKIRSIEHTITPGKWYTKLGFSPKGNSTYW